MTQATGFTHQHLITKAHAKSPSPHSQLAAAGKPPTFKPTPVDCATKLIGTEFRWDEPAASLSKPKPTPNSATRPATLSSATPPRICARPTAGYDLRLFELRSPLAVQRFNQTQNVERFCTNPSHRANSWNRRNEGPPQQTEAQRTMFWPRQAHSSDGHWSRMPLRQHRRRKPKSPPRVLW